jgi:MFS family permease
MKKKNLDNPWLIPLLSGLIPILGTIIGTILGPLFMSIVKDPVPAAPDQYASGDPHPFLIGAGVGLCLGVVIAALTVSALLRAAAKGVHYEEITDETPAAAH